MKIKLYQMKYIAGLCGNLTIIFFIIQVLVYVIKNFD